MAPGPNSSHSTDMTALTASSAALVPLRPASFSTRPRKSSVEVRCGEWLGS